MATHLEILNNAADTANAAASLTNSVSAFLDSLLNFLPKAGYALTIAAAFFPKPADEAPWIVKWAWKATHLVAWNVKHAANKEDQKPE